ncbi:unnamed protein product [Agarophyton chilense]
MDRFPRGRVQVFPLSTTPAAKSLFGKTKRKMTVRGCGKWTALVVLNLFVFCVSAGFVLSNSYKTVRPSNNTLESPLDAPALRNRLDWENEELPKFCSEIFKFPQPLRKNCSTASDIKGTPKCNPNRAMMFSQYGEDYYLYTRHFSKLNRPGVYLDIATNDPIGISNTYFLDRCLSWRGICIEANSKYYERIHRERSCALIPTCVSDKDGVTVEFALSGPGSGVVSTHRQGKIIQERAGAVVKKRCVNIMPQLERYGVKEVDYLNLDVEGHELTVLNSFDFDKVKVNVISIEIPTSTKDEIRELLAKNGFVRHFNENPSDGVEGMPIYPGNEFYLHSSVVWGHPE